MITVAIVDDHPAIRLGLHAALRSEAGLEPVGSAGNANETQVLLYRTRPDVVLLDYHLPGMDGLTLCRRIKSEIPAPAVVLYSAFADPTMTVPAIVAGADAIVHKGGQTREAVPAEIAATMRIERTQLDRRIAAMLTRLKVRVPVTGGPP